MVDPVIVLGSAPSSVAGFERPGLSLTPEPDFGVAKLLIHGPAADSRFVTITRLAPPPARQQIAETGLTFAWLAPGEWLICGRKSDVAAWLTDVAVGANEAVLALDITHGRTSFVLAGADARSALAAHCPLDLWDKSFRAGSVARSLLGDTTMFIARLEDVGGHARFRIIVDQSMATYAARILARG